MTTAPLIYRRRRPPTRRSFQRPGMRAGWLVGRAFAACLLGGLAIALCLALIGGLATTIPGMASTSKADKIVLAPLATRSVIYDAHGGEMAVLYAEQDRSEVKLSQVPAAVRTAVLTIEDADFYRHHGINVSSGLRALSSNIGAGGIQQGGSTITQQLIKNSITGSRQTVDRKVREAILAIQLEKQMSKDQILERYLNTVYLGHGAYGVEAASETYFDKRVEQLGWPEAALIASLIRNPVGYDPISNPALSTKRRALVARRLVETKHISPDQASMINATPLPTVTTKIAAATTKDQLVGGSYYAEEVKQFLLSLPALGATRADRYDQVFGGGLRVYTAYDPDAQREAERAVAKVPNSGGKYFAGLAALDARTGAVRAMVGGPDFATNKVNYVTQGWRQPGSSFKYFVLLAALEAGYLPADSISGIGPCRFPNSTSKGGVYEANNSHGGGAVADLTSQTQQSSNCAYLRLGQTVGLDKVAAIANALGMTTITSADASGNGGYSEVPIPSDILTIPIGTKEVHPLAMAAAYATAANDGIYNPAYYVDRITDSRGKEIYRHAPAGVRVVSSQTARLATQVLAANVTGGTGRKAMLRRQVAAGKTGTTDNHADVWFVGYTPYLATAVWIGSPTGLETVKFNGTEIFGGDYPAAVWGAFNNAYHQNLPVVAFPKPASLSRKGKLIRYTNSVDLSPATKRVTRPRSASSSTSKPGRNSATGSTNGSTNGPASTAPGTISPPASAPTTGGGTG